MLTAVICFGMLSVTYAICKFAEIRENKRQAKEYIALERAKLFPPEQREPSPYKLIRVQHSGSKMWGYTLAFKSTGKIYSWGERGVYEILEFEAAKSKLNEVEIAEGYTVTGWDV